MKKEILEFLKEMFLASGYTFVDSSNYDLVVEKMSKQTYIRYEKKVNKSIVEYYYEELDGYRGLLVIPCEVEDYIYEYSKKKGIILWDKNELAFQIGKYILNELEAEKDLFELFSKMNKNISHNKGGGFSEVFEPGSMQDLPYESLAPVENSFTKKDLHQSEEISNIKSQQHSEIDSYNNTLKLRSLVIKTSKEHASAIAKPHLGEIENIILKFSPFWKYKYSVQSEKKYKNKIIDLSGEGGGLFNAINANMDTHILAEVSDQVTIPNCKYEISTPMINKDDAQKAIMDMIVSKHTKDIRFDNTVGEAIISEHKRIKPSNKDIDLEIELVYTPIWDVRGKKNTVEINAHSGTVLENPVGDDVEFI